MALGIAGLNFGYAEQASPAVAELINWFWHFYENWIKFIFIIAGSILTLRIVSSSSKTAFRRKNLAGFMIYALLIHILGPYIVGNSELYLFSMPLPWNTTPLQLLDPGSSFFAERFPVLGMAGITASLVVYTLITFAVLVGTLLLGRRWQCSTLCLFNGFASEVFAPAFPLAGKKKQAGKSTLKIFSYLRWLFLAAALFFTTYWLLHLGGAIPSDSAGLISEVEIYKYLGGELLAAMFMWVVFTGRGYCYYCPLGTVLSFLGRAAGQRISTTEAECIECGKCNRACPLSIDIKKEAQIKAPVTDLRCVGCGHCIDTCPTETLRYTTRFLSSRR